VPRVGVLADLCGERRLTAQVSEYRDLWHPIRSHRDASDYLSIIPIARRVRRRSSGAGGGHDPADAMERIVGIAHYFSALA
jgi:hypothetical protein